MIIIIFKALNDDCVVGISRRFPFYASGEREVVRFVEEAEVGKFNMAD